MSISTRVHVSFLLAAAVLAVRLASPAILTAAGDKPAPDVKLASADGTVIHLADLKGKVVLIDFWASWCGPCNASFPALDSLYKEYRDRGVQIVAINVDEQRADANAFLAKRPHDMPVYFDPKGESPEAFGVKGMPTSFLIDRSGVIRFVHEGYNSKTIENFRHELNSLLATR